MDPLKSDKLPSAKDIPNPIENTQLRIEREERDLRLKLRSIVEQKLATQSVDEIFFGGVEYDNILKIVDTRPNVAVMNDVNHELERRFPQTMNLENMTWGDFCDYLRSSSPLQAEKVNQIINSAEERHLQRAKNHTDLSTLKERPAYNFIHTNDKKFHDRELYLLGAFLKGKPLDEKNVISDLNVQLHDKKILVLGDDVGSLSEILNSFGANAIGIEYDFELVSAAHAGIFSEDHLPQTQVIHGDIGDLTDMDSDLYKTLQSKGPFDVIFSKAVFNGGSGYEVAAIKYVKAIGYQPTCFTDEVDQIFGRKITDNSMPLLRDNAFCLHYDAPCDNFHFIDNPRKFKGAFQRSHVAFIPKEKYMALIHSSEASS